MKIVDPAEAALAVIGIRPILSKEVERVTMAQAHEMADLQKNIYTEAKNVVRGESSKVKINPINYKRMLNELFEGYNEKQVADMAALFPPILHEIASDFIMEAAKLVNFLRKLFPVQKTKTITTTIFVSPPKLAIQRFVTSFDVLDSPMRVFMHIANGSLLKSQVIAVRAVYPTISAAISDAFDEAKTVETARVKSFQLPPRVTIGLSTWNGSQRITPQLQQRLQENFVSQQKEQDKPQAPEGTAQSVAAKEAITNTQRALYPQTKAG